MKTLVGPAIEADLSRAFDVLGRTYLAHRSGSRRAAVDLGDMVALDAAVRSTEEPVDLRDARRVCPLIQTDSENPSEMFNILGHMFVLLQAIELTRRIGLVPTVCAATQDSSHEGEAVPDLGGEGWAVEAFGGGDIKNGGKLAKDLCKLAGITSGAHRLFVACRPIAWPRRDSDGARFPVRARCGPKHGGPFRADAEGCLAAGSAHAVLVEVKNIVVTDG